MCGSRGPRRPRSVSPAARRCARTIKPTRTKSTSSRRSNQERVSEDRRATTDLEVAVPRGASIEGRGRSGDFDITGVAGGVEISSDNAGVRLNKIGGSVKVDVKRSDIVRAVDVNGGVEVAGRGNDLGRRIFRGRAGGTGPFGATRS